MRRGSFTRRILMPPSLIFIVILVAITLNKMGNLLLKQITGLVIIASLLISPSIGSLLCFQQGGNRVERFLAGLIPFLAWISYQLLTALPFDWRRLIALLSMRETLIWIGAALLQLSLVEIWVLRKEAKG